MLSAIGRLRRVRSVSLTVVAAILVGSPATAIAQDTLAEARLRKIEAEIQAIQRKVFPGGDERFFKPEITSAAQPGATGQVPATSAVTDVLARMDAMETQLARLTGQVEESANRIRQLEEKAGIAAPAASASPAAIGPAPAPGAPAPAAIQGSAAPAPAPAAAPVPAAAPAPAITSAPQANLNAMSGGVSAAKPAVSAPPSGRVEAVRAIVKPQTDDPGDDEYSYGFRLWDAKFYPEAQQQLKMFVDKYPRHTRASWGRNLLGRAYLDDGQPREAAKWFLQNYQTDKTGARAPDSLLYLAVAMKDLKDAKRACIALAEFSETYAAESAGRLKDLYDGTRKGLSCPG